MNKLTTSLVFIALLITSCNKENISSQPSSNVWIVNGGIGLTKAVIKGGGHSGYIPFAGNRQFALLRTELPFDIVDTTEANIYNNDLELKSAAYTIFIAGQMPNLEVIINEETNLPFIAQDKAFSTLDSVVNVRFINLSPNSVPLKIKVSSASANEADALAYKQVTTWRPFKSTASTTTYSIQVRNAATDALLTTYSFVTPGPIATSNRFKNVTLMIRGLQGTTTGVNAFGVTPINYF